MGMAVKEKLSKEERRELLKALIYEKVKGKPIYYRDYKKVLEGTLQPEAVMGSNELQSLIVSLILKYLFKVLPDGFTVLTKELGFFTSPRSFRSLDIAIYKKEEMKKPQDKYTKRVPIVVIEIDTKADLSKYSSFEEYMYEKTTELLDAGVDKVIWYMTKVKKVLTAEKGKDWITVDWDRDIEVLDGVRLNIRELLDKEGIDIQ